MKDDCDECLTCEAKKRFEDQVFTELRLFISSFASELTFIYVQKLSQHAERTDPTDKAFIASKKSLGQIENILNQVIIHSFKGYTDLVNQTMDHLSTEIKQIANEKQWDEMPKKFDECKEKLNFLFFEKNEVLNIVRVFTQLFGIHLKIGD